MPFDKDLRPVSQKVRLMRSCFVTGVATQPLGEATMQDDKGAVKKDFGGNYLVLLLLKLGLIFHKVSIYTGL